VPGADRHLAVTAQTLAWHGSWTDVAAFESALDAADAASGADRAARLREAADLYTGDLLSGWYDDWLLADRDRLRRRALAALTATVSLAEAHGDGETAIRYAERARALDPLDEAAYRTLMRLHDARGDRARALRVYHECAGVLQRDLGVEPSDRTRAAYRALLPTGDDPAPRLAGTPYVGRPAERRRLTEVWQRSAAGDARFVLVGGEPGVGKTRLVEELRRWAAQRGAVTAGARSYAVEGTLPYAPLVAWLREPAVAARRARLDPGYAGALSRLLPELPGDARPDDGEDRVRLFEAAARALLAGPEPLLLIADDLHAADPYTGQFLHYLLRAEPGAPLLVVATARTAETDPDHPLHRLVSGLRALDRCDVVELDRLGAAEAAALAGRLAGRPLTAGQAARLYAETAGNPLFVVETVRAGWPQRGEPDALTPRVQAVLQARLDQLSPGARDLLGAAATAGSSLPVGVLSRLRPDEDVLTRELDELWRRRLLLAIGTDRYDFSHDKLREVAYRSLGPAHRRRHHRAVAGALRAAYAEHPGPVAGQIAAHLVAAGDRAEAVGWYVTAAGAAQRVLADADAAALLGRAADLLRDGPDAARRLDVLTALVGPLAAAEGYASPRLAAALDEALALTRDSGAEPAAPLLRAQGMALLSRGDAGAALAIGARLRALGESDDVLAVEGDFVQGMAAYWGGDLAAARRHLESALDRYRPENRSAHLRHFAQDPQVLCLARLAHVHLFGGDLAEARRLQQRSLELGRAVRHPFTLGAALLFAGLLDVELGDLDALRGHVAELDRLGAGATPIRLVADALAGYLDVADGRVADGLARIDAALADPGRRTAPGLPAMLVRVRLAACERAGDHAGGLSAARRLLAEDVRVWDGRARAVLAER
jgi:DNA-binding SARP family transcriptional activator